MWNPSEKIKFNVSNVLKDLNKRYHKNYTVQDVANEIGVSRETLVRLTTSSAFDTIYKVATCIYEFYPEYSEEWNLSTFIELLSWDDFSFIL